MLCRQGLFDTAYTLCLTMYNVLDIRHVHLEISSRCNAACPLCPRNFYGYPHNDGYVEHDMTLFEAKTIFTPLFIQQIDKLYINGNFGDAVMNHETVSIIEYFRSHSTNLKISMSTNAGARDRAYWQSLARLDVEVIFCIDGLEDTHSVYRQNTVYSTVIKNAKIFIQAGGDAIWKMINFDHNRSQQTQARELSKSMGFRHFNLVDHGRNQSPAFNNKKELVNIIGSPKNVDFDILWKSRTQDTVLLEDIVGERTPRPISCKVKKSKSIYISSTGDVYPCCYLGFNPREYGHGNYHAPVNAQVREILQPNNALENSLDKCIEWFDKVEASWQISTFEKGRLVICNDVCGKNNTNIGWG